MSNRKNRTHTGQGWLRSVVSFGAMAFVVGCGSMERSITLGVISGAAGGAGVGLMAGRRDRVEAALIGAGIGAVVGGVASYLIHGSLDKRDDTTRRDTLFNLGNHGIAVPSASKSDLSDVGGLLSQPEVEENWIETHTEGSKLIEGHRIWSITNGSKWDLSRKPATKRSK